jgi:hypothetical protein
MRNILAPNLLFSRQIFGAKSSFRVEYFGARSYSTSYSALVLECVESAVELLLGFFLVAIISGLLRLFLSF